MVTHVKWSIEVIDISIEQSYDIVLSYIINQICLDRNHKWISCKQNQNTLNVLTNECDTNLYVR